MGLHHGHIGKGRQHRVQVLQVMGRLQHPVFGGLLPVQKPQQGLKLAVGVGVVLPFQPLRIAWDMHRGFRGLAHEREVEQQDVLLRRIVGDGMHGKERRRR